MSWPATSPSSSTGSLRRRSTLSLDSIAAIQETARSKGDGVRPRWPMIVLRTPKGWTGPHDGRRRAGRRHVALASGPARRPPGTTPSTSGCSEQWMKSYAAGGAVRRGRCARPGAPRARPGGRTSHGRESPRRRRSSGDLRLPDFRDVRRRRRGAGGDDERAHSRSRRIPAGRHLAQPRPPSGSSGPTRPPRTGWAPSSRQRPRRGWQRRRRSTSPSHRTGA